MTNYTKCKEHVNFTKWCPVCMEEFKICVQKLIREGVR